MNFLPPAGRSAPNRRAPIGRWLRRHAALPCCLVSLLSYSVAAYAQPEPAAPATAAGPALIDPPRVLRQVPAEYPEGARVTGREGRVVLAVTVQADGSIGAVEVAGSSGEALDAAALAAIRQWSFAPATRDGVAVAAKIQVPFEFALPEGAPEGVPSGTAPGVLPATPPAADAAPVLPAAAGVEPPAPPSPPAEAPAAPVPPSEEVVVRGRVMARAEQRSASDFRVQRDVLHAAPHHEGVEVLRAAPGLYIARPEGAAVAHRYMLRGFDSEHGQDIEFKVAGFPINIPSHLHGQGYADLGFLIAETVDELRVTEGVHDPRQGDFAVAGSIDVRLGVVERGLTLRSEYGSFDTFRQLALWAPEDELRDSFAAVSYQSTDGFGQNRRGGSVSAVLQQGFTVESWRVRLSSIFYGARADMAGVLRRDDVEAGRVGFYDVYPLATARAQNALAARALVGLFGDYRGMAGENAEFGLWLGYDRFRAQQNFTGFLQRSRTLANVAGRGDLIEQRNRTLSLGASARYYSPAYEPFDFLEAHVEVGLSGRLDDIEQSQNLLDAVVRGQTWDERIDAGILGLDIGGWGDLDLHLTPAVQLRVGVRGDALAYEIDDRLGNFATLVRPQDTYIIGFRRSVFGTTWGPRTSLDVRPWEPLTLHASYGEGYRSPQARTLDDGERTPFTKVRSADVGARFSIDDALELTLAGYRTQLSDDVVFEASEGRLERVGATRRLGGVFHAQVRPWPGVVAAASVTYVDAELVDPPPATSEVPDPPFVRGQNLPFVPPVVVRADIGANGSLWTLGDTEALGGRVGVGLSALSSRPLPFGDYADPFAVLDVSGGLDFRFVELGLDVFNVLDTRYSSLEYSFTSAWDPAAPASRLPARHSNAGAPRTLLVTLELEL